MEQTDKITNMENNTQDEQKEMFERYFRLKAQYETMRNRVKTRLYEMVELSNKERREKLRSHKFQCVFCKRKVGSVFEFKNGSYFAYCGDIEEPCNERIEIKLKTHLPLTQVLDSAREGINDVKDEIIQLKTRSLLEYNEPREVTASFKELNENLNISAELYLQLRNKQETIDDIFQDEIASYEAKIQDALVRMKRLARENKIKENGLLHHHIAEIYLSEVRDNVKHLRERKYPYQEVNKIIGASAVPEYILCNTSLGPREKEEYFDIGIHDPTSQQPHE